MSDLQCFIAKLAMVKALCWSFLCVEFFCCKKCAFKEETLLDEVSCLCYILYCKDM